MRTWIINGKYPKFNNEGRIDEYEVTITSSGKYAGITETIPAEVFSKYSNEELIRAVLEAFSKSEFAEYHISEAVQKVDKFESRLSDAVKEIEAIKTEYQQNISDMKDEWESKSEASKIDFESTVKDIYTKIAYQSESIVKIQDSQTSFTNEAQIQTESLQGRIAALEDKVNPPETSDEEPSETPAVENTAATENKEG